MLMAMKAAIAQVACWSVVVVMAAMMLIGCDSALTVATSDPSKAAIENVSVPSHLCLGAKSPFQISLRVTLEPGSATTHYAWYEIWRSGQQDLVSSNYANFDTSQYVLFNGVSLGAGTYYLRAGLSFNEGVNIASYYQISALPYIYVDSVQCTFRTFSFDLYHQDFYDYAPKGVSALQAQYDAAHIALDAHIAPDPLPVERVEATQAGLTNYMVQNVQLGSQYASHAFAIEGLKFQGQPIPGMWGVTVRETYNSASYICVSQIQQHFVNSDVPEAVSTTSVHELGHLIADLTDLCVYPDSHVTDRCVMANIDVYPGTNDLEMACGALFISPYYPSFCDSCLVRLQTSVW
jgi:hypothetical protein